MYREKLLSIKYLDIFYGRNVPIYYYKYITSKCRILNFVSILETAKYMHINHQYITVISHTFITIKTFQNFLLRIIIISI